MLENSVWRQYNSENTFREKLSHFCTIEVINIIEDDKDLYGVLKAKLTKKELKLFAMDSAGLSDDVIKEAFSYDDEDGADLVIPFIGSWSFPIAYDIPITPLDLNWSSSPIELDPLGFKEETVSFSDSDIEQGIRLNDEYYIDNDLHVNIIFGTVTIQIYSFVIDVPIEIFNIYVSST